MVKLSVKDLAIRYGDTTALEGVNFEIRENEIFGIIGPANAGKTSFLKAVNRMDVFNSDMKVEGDIIFNNVNVRNVRNVYGLRSRIGVVFPLPVGLPLSIYDNVAYGPRIHSRRNGKQLDQIVERLASKGMLLAVTPVLSRSISAFWPSGNTDVVLLVGLGGSILLLILHLTFQQIKVTGIRHQVRESSDELVVIDRGRLVGHGRYGDLVHDQAADAERRRLEAEAARPGASLQLKARVYAMKAGRAEDAPSPFTTHDTCALCHDETSRGSAMRDVEDRIVKWFDWLLAGSVAVDGVLGVKERPRHHAGTWKGAVQPDSPRWMRNSSGPSVVPSR